MRFDILLFENFHLAQNHKYDVVLIARLLQSKGMNAGIVDVYGEDCEDEIEGVPIIHLTQPYSIPDDTYKLHPKNKLHSFLSFLRFLWQQHKYTKILLNEIRNMADMFYMGSYHTSMSTELLKLDKPVFLWGLRSSRMTGFWTYFWRQPVEAIRMLQLRYYFQKNKNNALFISNEIIQKEFNALGIPNERMILREERCVEDTPTPMFEDLSPVFRLLSIGFLREEKRIEKTIQAFQSLHCSDDDTSLTLAGKSLPKYERTISYAISDNKDGIERINHFVEYSEFYEFIRQSHFVVFGDIKQRSSVTNGTMLEALIHYRPIIAPNYDPYLWYIERYGVGISYNPDKDGDLLRAMRDAKELGCRHFEGNISQFLENIAFEKVASDLYSNIRKFCRS